MTFFANSSRSLFQVDLAEIEGQPLGLIVARRLRADGLVDDPVQFLEQLGHVGRVAPLGQLLVDRLDVVVPLGIGEGASAPSPAP